MNVIRFLLDGENHILETEISFKDSKNIAIDIINQVAKYSQALQSGSRTDITFYDLSENKKLYIPHMYPLQPGLVPVPISKEEKDLILKELKIKS